MIKTKESSIRKRRRILYKDPPSMGEKKILFPWQERVSAISIKRSRIHRLIPR